MSKRLTVLMCALFFLGLAALAAAEPAPSTARPAFFSQGASCPRATLADVPASTFLQEQGCQGGMYGSCDRKADCTGYACPLGELKACIGGTGSGCQGTCGCIP
jgi:hypothetical protein